MKYCAAVVLAAERPIPVRVGRFGYVARPVSVPVMLRVIDLTARAKANPADAPALLFEAELALLRAAFPRPSWWMRWRDPVPALLANGDIAQRRAMLERLTAMPVTAPVEAADPLAWIKKAQRTAVQGTTKGPAPTLAVAAFTMRVVLGEQWWHNPRYGTADGYVPHAQCWADYMGYDAFEARARLNLVQAHAVLQSGKQSRVHIAALMESVYPGEPAAPSYPH